MWCERKGPYITISDRALLIQRLHRRRSRSSALLHKRLAAAAMKMAAAMVWTHAKDMHLQRADGNRSSILVVDDDEDVRECLCDLLMHEGYGVASVADGGAALEHLATKPAPDVVLLDLRMPKMDGYEFLERRASDEALSMVPVVVISGTTGAHRIPFPGTFWLTAVLTKPLQPTLLFDVLRTIADVTTPKH